jgi:hypothetical protein
MNWIAELPKAWKAVTGAAVGLAAMLVGFSAWTAALHTDAEASELWQQHAQAEACRTVLQLRVEVRELETRLKFDATLTPDQRAWLQRQMEAILRDIARYDPHGVC